MSDRTIASLLSPPGVGGVAVIQVVGPQALIHTRPFLRTRNNASRPALVAGNLRLFAWVEGEEYLDEVIIAFQHTPDGLPAIQINTHGSVRVVERILMGLKERGVTIERASGVSSAWFGLSCLEQDVLQALPDCQTSRVTRWLVRQLERVTHETQQIAALLQQQRVHEAGAQVRAMLETYEAARTLIDGAKVVIIGPPNAGKSTLANRLFERPWSIESDLPGTTRDWVLHPIVIDGIPIHLADTAGLRHPIDELEREALLKSHPLILRSDVQILVLDAADREPAPRGQAMMDLLIPDRLIVAWNKADLVRVQKMHTHPSLGVQAAATIEISALQNEGLGNLCKLIIRTLRLPGDLEKRACVWSPRQRAMLSSTLEQITANSPDSAKAWLDRLLGAPAEK